MKYDFVVYPNNSVMTFGKYLLEHDSQVFLNKYKIPRERGNDEEKIFRGLYGFIFSTLGTAIGVCKCGNRILQTGANQCLMCYTSKSLLSSARNNRRKRGNKLDYGRSYEDLVKNFNEGIGGEYIPKNYDTLWMGRELIDKGRKIKRTKHE